MAIHTHTTPSGVNEPGLPALRLLRGGGTVHCRVLTDAEVAALVEHEASPPSGAMVPVRDGGADDLRHDTVTPVVATVAKTDPVIAGNEVRTAEAPARPEP